jgi:hypothetical protein
MMKTDCLKGQIGTDRNGDSRAGGIPIRGRDGSDDRAYDAQDYEQCRGQYERCAV